MSCRFLTSHIIVTLLFLSIASSVRANTSWILSPDQSGDWSESSNWDNGEPTSDVNTYVTNDGTVLVTESGEVCQSLSLNNASNLQINGGSLTPGKGWTLDGVSTVQMTSGNLTANSFGCNAYVGYSGSGSFEQSGGTNIIQNWGSFYLGYNVGANGSYDLSGAGSLSTVYQYVGYSGTGTFT